MARKPDERPFCRGTTKAGNSCKARAVAGTAYCPTHGGSKAPIGAPSKLTPDVHAVIVAAVSAGAYWTVAAEAAGISVDTLTRWRERGAEDVENGVESAYALLCGALTRAQADAELRMLRLIEAHAIEDWRAAAWYLERRAPERWSRRDKVDQTITHIARPRDVVPDENARDRILDLLDTAMRPPPGADE
jgi:hypothetical protein